jgi:DtxR family Mn-dependent transcriptional regulator
MEDYLEAIYQDVREGRPVRGKEIAARLGVRPASVAAALRQLSAKGLVRHEPYGEIALTTEGEALARDVMERHQLLRGFIFGVLGLPEAAADPAACRLEHALTPELRERLAEFVRFLDACSDAGAAGWRERFNYFLKNGKLPKACAACQAGGGKK